MSAAAKQRVVLRTAAVWGTTVLAIRELGPGQSLSIGDRPSALVPKPDGSPMSDSPIRAVGKGWEVDALGATGGTLSVRGRAEDPSALGRTGAPIPIVAGDHGLIQYGALSLFFQFSPEAPAIRSRRRIDWLFIAAFVFSVVTIGGGLTLLASLTTPRALEKPVELTSAEELAVQFLMDEPARVPDSGGRDAGKGIEQPGAKDKKDQGGGKLAKGSQGALGQKGKADRTEAPGNPEPLGAMSEVLASEVGAEVQKTLGSIASVADALGGLASDKIVLGRGSGLGFRGGGPGGRGDSDGVPFGSGTLDTGWGAGKGGGLGAGSEGPRGHGRDGVGPGGPGGGGGDGTGAAERKVQGASQAPSGQGLTPAQVQRVVLSRIGAFRACYDSAAARDPSLQGGVTIAWSITPDGSVSGARVASSSLGNPRVEGCILRQFNRLRFPTADKPTGASYPFIFKPGKG
jgi:hypothetical protein